MILLKDVLIFVALACDWAPFAPHGRFHGRLKGRLGDWLGVDRTERRVIEYSLLKTLYSSFTAFTALDTAAITIVSPTWLTEVELLAFGSHLTASFSLSSAT